VLKEAVLLALRARWATARLWRKRAMCLWARALSAMRPSFFLFFDVVAEVAANETVASTNVAKIRNIHLNRDVIWVTQKPTTSGEFVVALTNFQRASRGMNSQAERI